MSVYTWLVVLVLVAAVLFHGNRKHSNKFIFVTFLLLFAVIGLRNVNAFGSDASGYNGSYPLIYQRIGASSWHDLGSGDDNFYNIGFSFVAKAIYELTDGDYQLFVSILSLFYMVSYMRFIGKYSPSPIQSVLYFFGLLYYSLMFNALKQATAMAVLLFAFDAVIKRKPVKFLIISLAASLFHFPALVFLPAYWIAHMRVGRGYLILLAFLLLITSLFRNQLLNLMLSAYGEEDIDATMEGIRFLSNKVVIMIAIVILAIVVRPPQPEDDLYNAVLMFAGISIVFQTFSGYNNIFERLADYYFHTSIIFIPLIFDKDVTAGALVSSSGNKRATKVAVLLICIFSVLRFISYVNGSGLFTPYRFFWEK